MVESWRRRGRDVDSPWWRRRPKKALSKRLRRSGGYERLDGYERSSVCSEEQFASADTSVTLPQCWSRSVCSEEQFPSGATSVTLTQHVRSSVCSAQPASADTPVTSWHIERLSVCSVAPARSGGLHGISTSPSRARGVSSRGVSSRGVAATRLCGYPRHLARSPCSPWTASSNNFTRAFSEVRRVRRGRRAMVF